MNFEIINSWNSGWAVDFRINFFLLFIYYIRGLKRSGSSVHTTQPIWKIFAPNIHFIQYMDERGFRKCLKIIMFLSNGLPPISVYNVLHKTSSIIVILLLWSNIGLRVSIIFNFFLKHATILFFIIYCMWVSMCQLLIQFI